MGTATALQSPTLSMDLLAKLSSFEQQLSTLRAELEQSQRLAMLGTVAAMVAHEVNNLMTPILTYAQLAQLHPDDPALVQKALDRASAGAQQASRIASSILSLAKTHAAGELRQCDVCTAVSDAVACVPRGTLQRVQIELQLRQGLFAAISPVSLQQVILNLVLNAIKALAGKPGTITIRSTPQPSGVVKIEVEDTGPGLRQEVAAKVFEPFISDSGGTGLGLAICDRLVNEAGGTIWLANPGQPGARFSILLPQAG